MLTRTQPLDVPSVTTAVARGDEEAFDLLYAECSGRLHRFLFRLANGDAELAGDALQEAMIRVVRYLKPMQSEEQLWSWLFRVSRTAFIDLVRRRRKHEHVGALPEGGVGEDARRETEEADEALLGLLELAMEELEPADRELIEARYLQKRRVKDLAEERCTTIRAMDSRLARIRAKLKDKLQRRLARDRA